MAIQGFCPPSPSPSPPSHSPYYQLLERGSTRLGRVKKLKKGFFFITLHKTNHSGKYTFDCRDLLKLFNEEIEYLYCNSYFRFLSLFLDSNNPGIYHLIK